LRRHLALLPIVALYLVVAGLYASYTPAWQSPDEPAHYNVVRQMAEDGYPPLITDGDWDQDYLNQLTAARFAPELLTELEDIQYEDHQPPLYYALLVPTYMVTDGSLIPLRLTSVLIGVGVVVAAYAVVLRVYPGQRWAALGAAAFVGLVPQHVHILASVNNDALAWALGGWGLWACIDHAAGGRTPAWKLGVLVGLMLATKTTVYLMGGVVLLAVVLRAVAPHPLNPPLPAREGEGNLQPQPGRFPRLIRNTFVFGLAVLPLAALWWGRNMLFYGLFDPFGLRAHDAVVVGQLRTADYIAQVGMGAYLQTAVQTTYASFWGMFGWMAAPIPLWAQVGFGALILIGAVGLWVGRRTLTAARHAWLLMGVAGGLGVLMLVYYNTQFVQFQGRYAYALLIPLGVVVGVGLDALRARLPVVSRYGWLIPVALTVGLAALDVWLLARVIIPQLSVS
jgi:hypothetical protein